jgi:hypothetical protein
LSNRTIKNEDGKRHPRSSCPNVARYVRKKSITELRSSSLGINSKNVIRCHG